MNKFFYLFFVLSFFSIQLTNAQVFWQDNFEGTGPNMGGGDRDAPSHAIGDDGTLCSAGDYFVRTTNPGAVADPDGFDAIFTGIQASTYWRGEHITSCIVAPDVIDFTGISITGRSDLTFLGLFGNRDGTSWDASDEIRVEYQIDGGGYTTGIVFEVAGSGTTLAEDTNGDGAGDGTALSPAMGEFSFTIPGTGTTLDLRLSATSTGSEEFALDDFRISEIPLPVELTAFTATKKDKSTLLNWQTASEENNDYFQIERSMDGREFNLIAQVDGNGTTVQTVNYSYLDSEPQLGVNYYRLKQVDFGGAYEYSKIVSVEFRNDKDEISVYPNPFDQSVTVQFPSSDDSSTATSVRTIEIFDVYGRLAQSLQTSTEESNVTLDLSILFSGTYILRVMDGQRILSTQRITKL